MSDPDGSRPTPTELSNEELDQVSGGFDVVITGVLFEQDIAVQQNHCESASSTSFLSQTSATVFQLVGTGFDSMKDVFSALSNVSRLFNR